MYEYSYQRPEEVITTDFIDGFITNNSQLLSVPNEVSDLSNEKAFSNGMCPIHVKKMNDIKQVMKYTDHNHQDFWIAMHGRLTANEDHNE
jgi:hypothetical protein